MAEFTLALTKSALSGTLSRVKSAIEEEAKLRVRVQNDLVFITGEFEIIQAFLRVANAERTNEVVQTWVSQMRDLAYAVEDCVEFVVHLDSSKQSWAWLWRVLPACMAPPRLLDQAVAEIKQLRARVEDVSQRNTRYNLISHSGASNHAISQPAAASTTSAFHILSEVWAAAGKSSRTGNLKKLIMGEGSDLQVISVWGSTAQLGETHIITEAYTDQEIGRQYRSRAWVKLMHPLNPDDFLKSLLTQLYPWPHPAVNADGVELLQKLADQSYLIVLEQASTVVDWDFIRTYLPDNNKGSRIILLTKQLGVAIFCTGEPYQVLELKRASGDQYLCALYKKASQLNGIGTSEDPGRDRHLYKRRDKAREWANIFELVGRHEEMNKLMELVRRPGVVSVWGFCGAGKSALVRSFYYRQLLSVHCDKFTSFSWVDVPCPFDLTELSRRLFLDFHSDDLRAKEAAAVGMMDGHDLIEACREFLHQAKYLIVIDGLKSIYDWKLMKDALLSEPTDGSIVIITNEQRVAKECASPRGQDINVKGLNDEAALSMFIKIATRHGSEELTPDEMKIAKLTTAKCGGLPQVIAALGEYYQPLTRTYMLDTINDDFVLHLELFLPSLKGLFSWMQSYLEDCPDLLRQCIFYLKIFAADHSIRRRRLVRRWIAEAYIKETEYSNTDEIGEMTFWGMVNLGVIHQTASNKVLCQVNTFFRDYAFLHQKQDKLVFELEGRCSTSQRTGRHLTIMRSWDRDMTIFESMDLSRLRSLTVYGEWRPFFISAATNMRLLRVLDLEDTSGVTDSDMEAIGKLLPGLKFLSLRGCIGVTHLPSSLGFLRQLQTLDIKNTSIVTLPPAIIKLQKLEYIRAGNNHEPCDEKSGIVSILPAADENWRSTPQEDTDDMGLTLPAVASDDEENLVSAPREEAKGTGTGTSLPAEATADDEAHTSTPGTNNGPRALVFSWLSKLHRHTNACAHKGVQFTNAAVVIGKMKALRTLGFINVGGKTVVLRELKNLTQLRKLRLSGINRKNWQDFCCLISDHGYLESLSVRLDEVENNPTRGVIFSACFGEISNPPSTLRTLKVFRQGHARIRPLWIKLLPNLQKVDFDVTISTQQDIDSFETLPNQYIFHRIRVRPIPDCAELHFGCEYISYVLDVLDIDFTSGVVVSFEELATYSCEVLKVRCSGLSSVPIYGLGYLLGLREVWLQGTYCEALVRDMRLKLSEHHSNPFLRLA